jgi:hypothetical protein
VSGASAFSAILPIAKFAADWTVCGTIHAMGTVPAMAFSAIAVMLRLQGAGFNSSLLFLCLRACWQHRPSAPITNRCHNFPHRNLAVDRQVLDYRIRALLTQLDVLLCLTRGSAKPVTSRI